MFTLNNSILDKLEEIANSSEICICVTEDNFIGVSLTPSDGFSFQVVDFSLLIYYQYSGKSILMEYECKVGDLQAEATLKDLVKRLVKGVNRESITEPIPGFELKSFTCGDTYVGKTGIVEIGAWIPEDQQSEFLNSVKGLRYVSSDDSYIFMNGDLMQLLDICLNIYKM